MKAIEVKIDEYETGSSTLVDEHPIVNDKDYCEVVETVAKLHYSHSGCHFMEWGKTKDTPKEELIQAIIPRVIFGVWMEENWMKNFSDFEIEVPKVYDYEDGNTYAVDSIDNFINNCVYDENYDAVVGKLRKIAEQEYTVEIIDN